MYRRLLMATMGVALVGVTHLSGAVTLNPNGLGQALIYPYYTVNKGQDTLLTLANASDLGKVARVRFREGYNGREVLDFLVLLSPHDVWSAAITVADAGETAGAKLVTSDHSCTKPAIPVGGQAFSSANYTGGNVSPYNLRDSGPQTIARTREGHVQIVVNGDIVPDSPTDRIVRHAQNGTPGAGSPLCAQIPFVAIAADLVAPANTLGGSIGIVNVAEGTFFPYDALALADFTQSTLADNGSWVGYDDLNRANAGDGVPSATVFTDRGVATINYALGIDAVSAVFMAESVYNDVLINPALGAATDWVLTFPTRRYYVDGLAYPSSPRAPFGSRFENGAAPVTIGWHLYDNEELYVSDPCGPICGVPPSPATLTAPYEVNVIAFRPSEGAPATTSDVLGSHLVKTLTATYPDWTSGQADLDLAADENQSLATGTLNGAPVTLRGLPVAGFMVYNIINAQAHPGRLANYSGAFAHRKRVTCSSRTGQALPPCS
ncbi:hypothetical protein [Dokdonella sp.]|uniref:hypothetical protein n=1 Tax=Dokdonella sp. TaxID=2291710 RepID=UPI0037831208